MSRRSRIAMLAFAASVALASVLLLRPDPDPQPDTVAQAVSKGDDHQGHAGGHAPSEARADGGAPAARFDAGAPTIRTRASRPEGGVTVLRARRGETVSFAVATDTADEVHVHGYDLREPVRPGARAELAFPARIEGVFEVELEGSGTEIARLIVEPR